MLILVQHLNAQAEGIYRIKLVTVNKNSDLRIFNNLKDLGIVSFETHKDDMLRVYLGNYIGKFTADKILPTLASRGFRGAFIEKTGTAFRTEDGDSLTHTMQFIALRKLNIRPIVNNPNLKDVDKKDVYIWYHNGFYRVSFGMLKESQEEKMEHFKNLADNLGFKTSFLQKFAGVAPVAEKPIEKPVIQPKINIPSVEPIQKNKDMFELENKKSATEKKNDNSGFFLDPILRTKEVKINPNATLKPVKSNQ